MKAYRMSVNLKLGLIVFAVAIAVASLWYTNSLAEQLREREQSIIELWAMALAQVPKAAAQGAANPYQDELRELDRVLQQGTLTGPGARPLSPAQRENLRRAVVWAQGMPPANDLTFILDAFLEPNAFGIPAILVDSSMSQAVIWRNVPVAFETLVGVTGPDSARAARTLARLQEEMRASHEPIPIDLTYPSFDGGPPSRLVQYMLYGESELVRDLRRFPFVQLLFVALFVLVGYLSFSYVRRSEQSSLWVGMAKEAAHQLGTPISSLMGWLEVLRMPEKDRSRDDAALGEIEKDIARLERVTARFSDIGSLPKLETQPVDPVVRSIAEYMRERLPSRGREIRLETHMESGLRAELNPELFEWVIENLIKNAMDAMEAGGGNITIRGRLFEGNVRIDVTDTGKGIDRRDLKHIFKPGYSTKKRGWGLGLSLAKRIVEDYHGGTLTLHASKPGEGSTFRIEIPAVEGMPGPSNARSSDSPR